MDKNFNRAHRAPFLKDAKVVKGETEELAETIKNHTF